MTVLKLNNPRDFFEEITKPFFHDFFSQNSTFKNAFGLAMSLFNIHEWVFEFDKAKIETKYNQTFSGPGSFWKKVESLVPEAKYIRDLSNASKHVRLTIRPSTSMTHIANTSISISGWGNAGFDATRYGSQPTVTMADGTLDVSLDECAKKVFSYWETLIEELYPTPPVSLTIVSGSPTANQ
jgi:hypothetical protein